MLVRISKDNVEKFKNEIIHLINLTVDDINGSKAKYLDLVEYISNPQTYAFGHFNKDELVSFIWFYERNFDKKNRYHVSFLSVHENEQGKGLAKELMNRCENIAIENNIQIIDLNVNPTNQKAIGLYESLNYEPEKILMSKICLENKNV